MGIWNWSHLMLGNEWCDYSDSQNDGTYLFPGGRLGNPLRYSCLENPHGQRGLAGQGSQRAGHDWSDLAHTQLISGMLNRVTQVPWSWELPLSSSICQGDYFVIRAGTSKSPGLLTSALVDSLWLKGENLASSQPGPDLPCLGTACHRFSWAHYALVPGIILSHHLLSYLSREGLSMECCRVRDGCQVCDSSGMWWVYRPPCVHLCGCALCAPAFLCPFVGVPVCVPMCLSPQAHVHACLWTRVHSPTCMCLYDHGRWGPALW